MASSMTLVASHRRPQTAATRLSKAGQEPSESGISSTTQEPEDPESASPPAAAGAR